MKELSAGDVRTEENALIDLQFALIDAMKVNKITKADLARMLGVTPARVSQLLSAEANPTLKLASRALDAVGRRAEYVEKVRAKREAHSARQKPWFVAIVQEDERVARAWGVAPRRAANRNGDATSLRRVAA
jgi:transcriptional regulator with XRE-family HTH domain